MAHLTLGRACWEDMDIASGRITMSPKELQAERFRDTQQTQCIERARTRCSRVIEGLRTILQRGLQTASVDFTGFVAPAAVPPPTKRPAPATALPAVTESRR